jgi:activator of 2-hydroxyglutaryl-CoA dehydratase
VPLEEVIAGYHHAMARRISTLVGRAGLKKDFVVIGGLAKNPGILDRVESILNITRLAPKPEWDPAVTVALGAALFADGFYARALKN